ncbi:MAG: hypothetical protein IJ301_00520 [Clostridia bacterium]|nr:hypothetical protein [Clostridia bacterium]
MKRIFVCAGVGVAKNENINEQAKLLGEILGKNNGVVNDVRELNLGNI